MKKIFVTCGIATLAFTQSVAATDFSIVEPSSGGGDSGVVAGLVAIAILGIIFGGGSGASGSSKSPKLDTKKPKSKILQRF